MGGRSHSPLSVRLVAVGPAGTTQHTTAVAALTDHDLLIIAQARDLALNCVRAVRAFTGYEDAVLANADALGRTQSILGDLAAIAERVAELDRSSPAEGPDIGVDQAKWLQFMTAQTCNVHDRDAFDLIRHPDPAGSGGTTG